MGECDKNICDKCGGNVPRDNDARLLERVIYSVNSEFYVLLVRATRHLLPVIENGVVVCKGSPSRAQYIKGQPRDPRAEYSYLPEWEEFYRAAYDELLRGTSVS
jgi:hypothetical protein